MTPCAAARGEQRLGLGDDRPIPQRLVLLGERHVVALGRAAGPTPRLGVQHQRQQSLRLGLLRQQLGRQPRQEQRFPGEVAARRIGSPWIGPAFGERRIDGVEHGAEPPRQSLALGNGEGDAGLPDLVLGPHQPLGHGRRRGEEGRGDGLGVEAEHGLQDQWRADGDIDRRMGAGKHQRQPPVRDFRIGRRRVQPIAEDLQLCRDDLAAAALARGVDDLAACGRDQPGLRVGRTAIDRPIRKRRRKRVGQRILGQRHIARVRGQEGDELAIAAAGNRLGCAVRVAAASVHIVAQAVTPARS